MSPSLDFEANRQKQEEHLLTSMTSQLSDVDRQELHRKALELVELQNTEEDLSCLPTLRVKDIDRSMKTTEISTENISKISRNFSNFLFEVFIGYIGTVTCKR